MKTIIYKEVKVMATGLKSRIIYREKFFMYIDIARYVGHTVYDYTGF